LVGAAGEAIWARCAKVLRHPEWCEDPRFATNQARMANRDALEGVMNTVLATKATNDWVEVLEAAGVPCGPVYDYAQMFADPQVRHRGLVQYASDPELGEVPHIRTGQDRRRGAGAQCRAQTRPAQRRNLWPPRGQRDGNEGAARLGRTVIV
jgi:crotonobetainyl-CoA:carnitine CoA-transferase CaiB-like acyl-CoA transferase